jgi:hypothetical protein
MGLIRKMASASTLGGVKYTSRREAQTKAALEQARLAKAERRALKGEHAANVEAQQTAQQQADQDKPWWAQKTTGAMIGAAIRQRKAGTPPAE